MKCRHLAALALITSAVSAACSGDRAESDAVEIHQALTANYFTFFSGDARGYTGDGDWSFGNWKGECATNQAATGLSVQASDTRPHTLQCEQGRAGWGSTAATVTPYGADSRRDASTGDWSFGYFKGECGLSEVVVGISHASGVVHDLRCASNGVSTSSVGCNTRGVGTSDDRGRTSSGDWDFGYYKSECADGQYVKGISIDPSSKKAHALLCCSVGGGGTSGVAGVVSSSQFAAWFPNRNALYSYSGLTSINAKYADFANSSDMTMRKREAAAYLANFALETGDGVYTRETCWQGTNPDGSCVNWSAYCGGTCGSGCPAGTNQYYGRGWMQLSWNCNYQAAGNALGYDLLNHPDWVATDSTISAQTGAWYWNTQNGPGGYGGNCHNAILASDGAGGFGETIKHINGGLECPSMGGSNTASRDSRIAKYTFFCDQLGVSYGNNTSC